MRMNYFPAETALPVSSEQESFFHDLLYAAGCVSLICGLNLVGNVPVFTVFAALTLLTSLRSLSRSTFLKHLLVPPLLVFLTIHFSSAFRMSLSNGLIFLLQGLVIAAFVTAFVNRYAQISMVRYLRLTGIGMTALLIFVVAYHLAHHRYVSWKLLSDPKAVFDVLPIMLLVLRYSRTKAAKAMFPILLPLFTMLILLSGERKAYLLMLLFAPLLINFRSVTTYVLPFLAIGAISIGVSLDRSGYVQRQISTLEQFVQGKTERTVSNESRSWAIRHAGKLFVENPILGVGTNGYSRTVDPSLHLNSATHNEWLRVAADNGIVGLFFYTAALIWGFVGLLRPRVGARTRTSQEKILAFGLFATFVMYLSFEAIDFIVMTAFILAPLVQFLRLDPNAAQAVDVGSDRVPAGVVEAGSI